MTLREEDLQMYETPKKNIKDWFQIANNQYMLEIPKQSRLGNRLKPLSFLLKPIINCDPVKVERGYMLTPKHTKFIRDIHHPTLLKFEIIHNCNLKHDLYMGF